MIYTSVEIRKIIIDHYSNPSNFLQINNLNNKYLWIDVNSDRCVDNFQIAILVEKKVIMDIKFLGTGCAISTSSLDILISLIIGKGIKNSIKIINEYFKLINHEECNLLLLDDLQVFANVYKQKSRIKCAKIGAHSILNLLTNIS